MSAGSTTRDEPAHARRRYDSPVRRQQVAATRDRIVSAGSALVHEFPSWDWRGLTFRAVAKWAGVSERTVYRHFATERQLHEAVMRRLEVEAGIAYEGLELSDLAQVTARIFASVHSFAVPPLVVDDPTFVAVDERRRAALLEAVTPFTADWTDAARNQVAALLDVLWNLPTYERLITAWAMPAADAAEAITWLVDLVVQSVHDGRHPRGTSPTDARGAGS